MFRFIPSSTLQTIRNRTRFAHNLDRGNRTRHRRAQETPDLNKDTHAMPRFNQTAKSGQPGQCQKLLRQKPKSYSRRTIRFVNSCTPWFRQKQNVWLQESIQTLAVTTSENLYALCHTSHSHRVCYSQHTINTPYRTSVLSKSWCAQYRLHHAAETGARTPDNAKHSTPKPKSYSRRTIWFLNSWISWFHQKPNIRPQESLCNFCYD